MKKVIKGRLYDTTKAKKLGVYEPNHNQSDFSYYSEELYQKKTGEFFLYGEGNASSPYSKKCGSNEWCGSKEIKPMSYQEAQEWAEKHLDGDDYIAIFGEPVDDDSRQTISLSLSAHKVAKLKQAAAREGISISAYIENLIERDAHE